MGNPIQYRNTDNKGGFHKMASVRPPGRTQRGVNENVSPDIPGKHHNVSLMRDVIWFPNFHNWMMYCITEGCGRRVF